MASVSNIKVFPVAGQKSIKANVEFVIGETLFVRGAIIEGSNGLFVSLPGSRKYTDKTTNEEKWANDVRFVTKEIGNEIQAQILSAYKGGSAANTSTSATPAGKSPRNGGGSPF